jgi:hypothetical protein
MDSPGGDGLVDHEELVGTSHRVLAGDVDDDVVIADHSTSSSACGR